MTLEPDTQTAIMTALINLLSGGSIQFLNAAKDTVIATINLNTPAFTLSATPGVANLNVTPAVQGTTVSAGTIVFARLKKSNGDVVLTLTCGTSGTEIAMSSNVVGLGDMIQITSLSLGQPAS